MGDEVPRPRFAVGMRGYDRGQVDAFVGENARWAAQAWGRIMELEARVSELEGSDAPQRVRRNVGQTIEEARLTLDALVEKFDLKAAELEEAVRRAAQPQLDELRDHVGDLEDQRRSALARVAELRESLDYLVTGVNGHHKHTPGSDGGRPPAESDSAGRATIFPEMGDQ